MKTGTHTQVPVPMTNVPLVRYSSMAKKYL